MCLVPSGVRREHWSPGTEATDSCELPCRHWELTWILYESNNCSSHTSHLSSLILFYYHFLRQGLILQPWLACNLLMAFCLYLSTSQDCWSALTLRPQWGLKNEWSKREYTRDTFSSKSRGGRGLAQQDST